jgi:hypothetical protein
MRALCQYDLPPLADTLSAYMLTLTDRKGRTLGLVSVALFTAVGFLLFAWIAAGVSFLLSSLRVRVCYCQSRALVV